MTTTIGGARRRGTASLATALTLMAIPGPAAGQEPVASRIVAVGTGEVRLSYSVRPDVCGNGEDMIRFRESESWIRAGGTQWRDGRRWSPRCIDGPARVSLTVRDGAVARVRAVVGGGWADRPAGVTDLGRLDPADAARGLLLLARRSDSRAADDLVFPAVLADSVTLWPDLLALARDDAAANRARKAAIFWLSQEAGEAVTRGLSELAGDQALSRDLREQAVFALSQLPGDEGVPILIRAARSNPDPAIRRKALFWLGQSDDPRALALFEEILSRP